MDKDNQQAKPNLFELGRISALIDGEGWLIFNRQALPSKRFRYVPVIGMNSTSKRLADEMDSTLQKHGIGLWRGMRNFSNPNHKMQYMIRVQGFKRCLRLLELFGEFLVEKLEQARLLKEYIKYRLQLPPQSPCGEKEEAYRQRLMKLNS